MMTQQEFEAKLKALLDEANVDLQPTMIINVVPRVNSNPFAYVPVAQPPVAPSEPSEPSAPSAPVADVVDAEPKAEPQPEPAPASEPSAPEGKDAGVVDPSGTPADGGEAGVG